jgi:hypothetical protein
MLSPFRLLAITSMVVLLAASALAQESKTPDLTGTWTLNLAKSKVRKGATPGPQTVEISCRPTDVVITETVGDKETTFIYSTDGKAEPIAEVRGGKIIAKAYWKQSTLVIETFGVQTSPGSPPPGSRSQAPLTPILKRKCMASSDGRFPLTEKSSRGISATQNRFSFTTSNSRGAGIILQIPG